MLALEPRAIYVGYGCIQRDLGIRKTVAVDLEQYR